PDACHSCRSSRAIDSKASLSDGRQASCHWRMASSVPPAAKLTVGAAANRARAAAQNAPTARPVDAITRTTIEAREGADQKRPRTQPTSSPLVGNATATRTRRLAAKNGTELRHEGTKHTKIQNLKNFVTFVSSRLALRV